MSESGFNKTIEYYSKVEPKEVDWLWYPYIPYGKLTLIQGDPGEGKSTFVIQLISLLTKGARLPDGSMTKNPVNVIYQCAEDGIEDTVRPRLNQAGADCNRVAFIPEADMPITLEDDRIEQAIADARANVLVLDPLQAFVSPDADMQSAVKMRNVLRKLADLAQKYHCAIILVGHMNKASGGKKQLYRGLGSIDIAAIVRSILMITRDPEVPEIRYMIPIKSSLSPEGCAIEFYMDPENGFKWIGKSDFTASMLSEEVSTETKKAKAMELLQNILYDGDVLATDIMESMKQQGISVKTARNAQKELGVVSYKKGNVWYWHMDDEKG